MTPKQKLIQEILEEIYETDKKAMLFVVPKIGETGKMDIHKLLDLALSKQTEQFLKILDEFLNNEHMKLWKEYKEVGPFGQELRIWKHSVLDGLEEDLKQKLKKRCL